MTPTPQQVDRDLAIFAGYEISSSDKHDPKTTLTVCGDGDLRRFVNVGAAYRGQEKVWMRWSAWECRDDLAEVLAKLTDEQWMRMEVEFFNSSVQALLTATPAQVALAVWRAVCQ